MQLLANLSQERRRKLLLSSVLSWCFSGPLGILLVMKSLKDGWCIIVTLISLRFGETMCVHAIPTYLWYRCTRVKNIKIVTRCRDNSEEKLLCFALMWTLCWGDSLPDFCTWSCPALDSRADVIREYQLKQTKLGSSCQSLALHGQTLCVSGG